MTKEERAMLREAAEKATPGPWNTVEANMVRPGIDGPGGRAVVWLTNRCEEGIPEINDARFIAASNPATILSLLDALDGAERELEQWRNLSAKPSPEALAEGVAELYGKWQAALSQKDKS